MTILCATDFSPCSAAATELAAIVARRFGDSLCLVHVVEPSILTLPEVPVGASGWQFAQKQAAEARIAHESHALSHTGLSVQTRVFMGTPDAIIPDTARELGARLIVAGTHGRKGIARFFLGSVAEHVMRRAPCPVLVLRSGTELGRWTGLNPLRIVVATDLTNTANKAITPAYDLLHAGGGQVDLYYVHPQERSDDLMDLSLSPPLTNAERAEVESKLRALEPPEAAGFGITTSISVVEGSSVEDALLRKIEQPDVDLIALASHGRWGVRRAVAGSVAEEVVRHASKPVLIIHSRDGD